MMESVNANRGGLEHYHLTLEKLLPEIRILILSQFPSLKSLYSLLRASPHYYQSFLVAKKQVLFAVLCRSIQPEVLPYAIAASGFLSRLKRPKLSRHDPTRFMQRFKKQKSLQSSMTPLPLSLSMSIYLCQLHRSIQLLVTDFTGYTTSILGSCRQSLGLANGHSTTDGLDAAALSEVEAGRLQRAFYHFEIYSQLFRTNSCASIGPNAADQSRMFLAHLLDWEVEEMASVHKYLLANLAEVFDQVEFDFVRSVADEDPVDPRSLTTPGDPRYFSHEDDCWKDYVDPSWRFMEGDSFFSTVTKQSYHAKYMEYMVALGLPFLCRIFTTKGQELKQLVTANCDVGEDFFAKALAISRIHTEALELEQSAHARGEKLQFKGDRIDQPNEGWLWARESIYSVLYNSTLARNFQLWGYVFWDSQRLRASGLMSLT